MNRYKYPRTYHLPSSPGKSSDDKVIKDLDDLIGYEVVITEKMDGENTSIYNDGYLHARSIDGSNHLSRNWVKSVIVPKIIGQISDNMRVCGENVYAKHSIEYNDLESYFYGFSVWYGDVCLDWDSTLELFEGLGIVPVKVLYKGIFSRNIVDALVKEMDFSKQEGFVVRRTCEVHFDEFDRYVAKYVRKGHVMTEEHWAHSAIVPNGIKR